MKLCLKQWKNKQKFQEMVFLTSTLKNKYSKTDTRQVVQEVQRSYEGKQQQEASMGSLSEKHCVDINTILRWHPHLETLGTTSIL